MAMDNHTKIPQATAKRLPLYYRFINNLYKQGKTRVSSKELSEAVKVDSATIRRDFSYFGALGKKGYGYNVNYLLSFFKQTLEQDTFTKVVLIGVGNLGTAFLQYNFTKNNNTKIVMAFDTNEEKIGKEVGGVPVYHIDEMEKRMKNEEIAIAILTVPAHAAESMTERAIELGVQGILNFTPARINVPPHIRVHHIDLSIELQALAYFLKHYPLEEEKQE
jgi:redox-sensing transcriptional repressor